MRDGRSEIRERGSEKRESEKAVEERLATARRIRRFGRLDKLTAARLKPRAEPKGNQTLSGEFFATEGT